MIFNNVLKNFIYEPVSFLGILVFYILLINLPVTLISNFTKKTASIVRALTILVNISIAILLIFRWIISGHFPISNLYESLYFLVWGITLGQLLIEREYKSTIIQSLAISFELLKLLLYFKKRFVFWNIEILKIFQYCNLWKNIEIM